MKKTTYLIILTIMLLNISWADCPNDHFLIGRNQDGVDGTSDDMKLFLNVEHVYRHSDPERLGENTWLNWYYPMEYDDWFEEYYLEDEPGFETIENDPNQQLIGVKNTDYKIRIRCNRIYDGLIVQNTPEGINLTEPNDSFCFSELDHNHVHLDYLYPWPASENEPNEPLWVVYQIYDELDYYEPSGEFTLVLLKAPVSGDIEVDGAVDLYDLQKMVQFWLYATDESLLNDSGQAAMDVFNRADINRDYNVNLVDYSIFAEDWLLE